MSADLFSQLSPVSELFYELTYSGNALRVILCYLTLSLALALERSRPARCARPGGSSRKAATSSSREKRVAAETGCSQEPRAAAGLSWPSPVLPNSVAAPGCSLTAPGARLLDPRETMQITSIMTDLAAQIQATANFLAIRVGSAS